MYLSHYVDMDLDLAASTLDGNSYDGYLSAYITNLDRTAYKKYLSLGSAGRIFNDLRSASTTITGLVYTGNGIIEELKAGTYHLETFRDKLKGASDVLGIGLSGIALKESIESLNKNIGIYENPKDLIEALENDLNYEDYGKEAESLKWGMFFAIIGAVGGAGLAGTFVVVGLSSINMIAMTYKDVYDRANWTAMVYTVKARLAERYMRYFEW